MMDSFMLRESTLRLAFRIAAVYNVAWGIVVILFPNALFDLAGIPRINYPFLMSGIGMFVGVYGYGYWVVANDLRRYPQLVVIGFLGKTLGPLGWIHTVAEGLIPPHTLLVNVFNDLIWLPFFVAYFIWYRRAASPQVEHGR
jgi:small multidrug resistance pump